MPKVPVLPTGLSPAPHANSGRTTFLRVLPRRIVQYRELRGISQGALATAAGVSKSTMNSIESGLARDIKVSTLERICHVLGVSADALLGLNWVNLVRRPCLRGIQTVHADALAVPHSCPTCGRSIAARALHMPGDCMIALSDQGATAERIGAVFGLSTGAIELTLREETEHRRHRKF